MWLWLEAARRGAEEEAARIAAEAEAAQIADQRADETADQMNGEAAPSGAEQAALWQQVERIIASNRDATTAPT